MADLKVKRFGGGTRTGLFFSMPGLNNSDARQKLFDWLLSAEGKQEVVLNLPEPAFQQGNRKSSVVWKLYPVGAEEQLNDDSAFAISLDSGEEVLFGHSQKFTLTACVRDNNVEHFRATILVTYSLIIHPTGMHELYLRWSMTCIDWITKSKVSQFTQHQFPVVLCREILFHINRGSYRMAHMLLDTVAEQVALGRSGVKVHHALDATAVGLDREDTIFLQKAGLDDLSKGKNVSIHDIMSNLEQSGTPDVMDTFLLEVAQADDRFSELERISMDLPALEEFLKKKDQQRDKMSELLSKQPRDEYLITNLLRSQKSQIQYAGWHFVEKHLNMTGYWYGWHVLPDAINQQTGENRQQEDKYRLTTSSEPFGRTRFYGYALNEFEDYPKILGILRHASKGSDAGRIWEQRYNDSDIFLPARETSGWLIKKYGSYLRHIHLYRSSKDAA
jgi:hypothetical protein